MNVKSMVPERLIMDAQENVELVQQHIARYEFAKAFIRGKSVLDIACGSGYGSSMLKEAGARSILGVDISDKAVEHARQHYSQNNVDFVVGTAEHLTSYGQFDTIVSFETIEHLEQPEIFLAELCRVLRPDGRLIISTPVRERGTLRDKPKNQYHIREWSQDEFRELLQQYVHVVDVFGQYNFKKWFPCSRTLQRLIFKSLFPQRFLDIGPYPVLANPPRHRGFRFEMAGVLFVCDKMSGPR